MASASYRFTDEDERRAAVLPLPFFLQPIRVDDLTTSLPLHLVGGGSLQVGLLGFHAVAKHPHQPINNVNVALFRRHNVIHAAATATTCSFSLHQTHTCTYAG
jgi:hypothetical protein